MADIEKILHSIPQTVLASSAYDASRPECRIKLDGNESPFDISAEVRERIIAAAQSVKLNRYPDPDCEWLRGVISEQTGVSPGGIVFGNGSDELIQMALTAFCGASENVLVPTPTFSMYALTAANLGKNVFHESLDGAFDLDERAMLRSIKLHNPDIVFLASPNSPTGNLLSQAKVESVIAAAPGLVVVDEAYFHFCGKTHIDLMEKYENLAVMRTFSKIGLAAIRLGFLLMRPELAVQMSKIRLPYNINSLTQAAARVFFEDQTAFEKNVRIIVAEREKMFDSLRSIDGIKVFPSDANFFLIRFPDPAAAQKVHCELINKSILVRNFPEGDISCCLRVTVGLAAENREFEKCLREFVSRGL